MTAPAAAGPRPRPRLLRLAAFGAGALFALGHAPFALPWIALCGLVVALPLISHAPSWREAAWRGWLFGFGHFVVAWHWIVEPFLVDIERHGWMAPFGLLGLAGGMALYGAAASGLAWKLSGEPWRRTLWLVVLFTAAEILRGWLFSGFAWSGLGHIWIGSPQMQVAALGGSPMLTLMTLFAAALPALLGAQRALIGIFLAGALLALPVPFALMRVPPEASLGEGATIRLIQPNAPQHQKWHPDFVPVFWQRHLEETAAPMENGERPALVIWPETAIPYFIDAYPEALEMIAEAAQGSAVIAGAQRRDAYRYYNSLVHIDGDGELAAIYDKHHLVPFGEFMPFEELFSRLGIFGLAANTGGGYARGPGPVLLPLGEGLGDAVPLICYEAVFPRAISGAPERPDWLLHITNDAWFGTFAGPYQHLDQARLRAVEQGLPMLRAANTGVSAVIDPYGRILEALPLGEHGRIDAALPIGLPSTPFALWGNLPVWVALALLAGIAARRSPRSGPSDLH